MSNSIQTLDAISTIIEPSPAGHIQRDCLNCRHWVIKTRHCFNCNQPGHISANCPQRQGNDHGGANQGQWAPLSPVSPWDVDGVVVTAVRKSSCYNRKDMRSRSRNYVGVWFPVLLVREGESSGIVKIEPEKPVYLVTASAGWSFTDDGPHKSPSVTRWARINAYICCCWKPFEPSNTGIRFYAWKHTGIRLQ